MEEHGVENAQKSPYCGLRIYWLIFFFLVGVCHSKGLFLSARYPTDMIAVLESLRTIVEFCSQFCLYYLAIVSLKKLLV